MKAANTSNTRLNTSLISIADWFKVRFYTWNGRVNNGIVLEMFSSFGAIIAGRNEYNQSDAW